MKLIVITARIEAQAWDTWSVMGCIKIREGSKTAIYPLNKLLKEYTCTKTALIHQTKHIGQCVLGVYIALYNSQWAFLTYYDIHATSYN